MPRKMTRSEYNAFMKVYMLERYRRRIAAARLALGGRCVQCGARKGLDFDHIDRRTKLFTISKGWSVSKERFWAEVAKCQLLCGAGKCHQKKGRAVGDVRPESPHGSINRYVRYKCRCGPCRAAMTAASKRWRVNRKRRLASVAQPARARVS